MTPKKIAKELEKLMELQSVVQMDMDDYAQSASELACAIQEYVDERSERWQEGETGQAYLSLISELEDLEGEIPEVPELNL